jgi:hypothetical protein
VNSEGQAGMEEGGELPVVKDGCFQESKFMLFLLSHHCTTEAVVFLEY